MDWSQHQQSTYSILWFEIIDMKHFSSFNQTLSLKISYWVKEEKTWLFVTIIWTQPGRDWESFLRPKFLRLNLRKKLISINQFKIVQRKNWKEDSKMLMIYLFAWLHQDEKLGIKITLRLRYLQRYCIWWLNSYIYCELKHFNLVYNDIFNTYFCFS